MSALAGILAAVAAGRPPPADGRVEVVPQDGATPAVVALTAHHVIAADVDPGWVRAQLPDGDLGAPTSAPFLAALAERLGRSAGTLDVVLVAPAAAGGPPLELVEVGAAAEHPRVARAARYRSDLRVWEAAGGDAVVVVGRGLAGRWEAAYEVEPGARGRGLGRQLAAAARHLVPAGEALWLQVAPGNVPSLRVALAAGYVPVGAEILLP